MEFIVVMLPRFIAKFKSTNRFLSIKRAKRRRQYNIYIFFSSRTKLMIAVDLNWVVSELRCEQILYPRVNFYQNNSYEEKTSPKTKNSKIFPTTNLRTKFKLYICNEQRKLLIGIIMLKRLTSNILYSFTFTRNRNYLKDSAELFNT